jgi:hypothetical protein
MMLKEMGIGKLVGKKTKMSDIQIDLKISLNNLEVEFMRHKFNDRDEWIIMDFYHSATVSLGYMGLLTTTTLRKDGVKTDKTFLLMTALGKEVYDKINQNKDE